MQSRHRGRSTPLRRARAGERRSAPAVAARHATNSIRGHALTPHRTKAGARRFGSPYADPTKGRISCGHRREAHSNDRRRIRFSRIIPRKDILSARRTDRHPHGDAFGQRGWHGSKRQIAHFLHSCHFMILASAPAENGPAYRQHQGKEPCCPFCQNSPHRPPNGPATGRPASPAPQIVRQYRLILC